MQAPKAQLTFSEPSPSDREWLDQQVVRAAALATRYAGISIRPEIDLDTLDLVIEAWSRDPAGDRAHPTEIAGACGVAVGRLIARRIGLKWMVCQNGDQRVLALWGRSASGADVSVAPVGLVAERLQERMTGFLAELASSLREDLHEQLAE